MTAPYARGAYSDMRFPAAMAIALTLIGFNPAAAQDICRKGRDIRLLELMLENDRSRARMAYPHGDVARGDLLAAQAARIEADLPFAQLRQEINGFPFFRNPRCMMHMYSVVTGQTVFAEGREDGTWTIYVEQTEGVSPIYDRLTDQQLLDLVRSINR